MSVDSFDLFKSERQMFYLILKMFLLVEYLSAQARVLDVFPLQVCVLQFLLICEEVFLFWFVIAEDYISALDLAFLASLVSFFTFFEKFTFKGHSVVLDFI